MPNMRHCQASNVRQLLVNIPRMSRAVRASPSLTLPPNACGHTLLHRYAAFRVAGAFSFTMWASIALHHRRTRFDLFEPCVSRSRSTSATICSRSCKRRLDLPAEIDTNASAVPRLVHCAGMRLSSPTSSRKYTRSSPQAVRRSTRTNSRPRSGWNGCVTRNDCARSTGSRAVDGPCQRDR